MSNEMKSTWMGRSVSRSYHRLPFRNHVLGWVVRREGDQFCSETLRTVLRDVYDIEVGPHSYGSLLNPGMCDRHTRIGAFVSIGPNVRRFGAAHPISAISMHPYWYNSNLGYVDKTQDVERTQCHIEDEVWIGANVTILPGCSRIGIGAVVGAGSIVTRDVPEFSIVAGNPARVIGERLTAAQRRTLKELTGLNHTPRRRRAIAQHGHQ